MNDSIQISNAFKKQTSRAIGAIVLFILIYLILVGLAVVLALFCTYFGISIILIRVSYLTIILGLGIIAMAFTVLFFLVKFIFKKHVVDRSHLVEIKREEEPELFSFIQEIVDEVETDFPKKVYLSTEVNASVFYNSSFWSMFLPIRKNLHIGLGLVNSVSVEEFKAILAHEFGHFSQKTMKVGSYVYNVNQVIYNLLYDNESFDQTMSKFAESSGGVAIFISIAFYIIRGIQWVLVKMYDVVNLAYMGLSREMEFHADEVAANVAGSKALQSSLLRLDLAQNALTAVLNYYEEKISEQLKSENIFKEQSFVMETIAKENKLSFKEHLPQMSLEELKQLNRSKLVVKDQWASHPSTEDRIKALEKLNIQKSEDNFESANVLFSQASQRQSQLTAHLFSNVQYKESPSFASEQRFQEDYLRERQLNSFPLVYKGFYDNLNPRYVEPEQLDFSNLPNSLEDLFNPKYQEQLNNHLTLINDLEGIRAIEMKAIPIRSFDYDGQKYRVKDAGVLAVRLKEKEQELAQQVETHHQLIQAFFYQAAQEKGEAETYKAKYQAFQELDESFQKKLEYYQKIIRAVQFIQETTPYEVIQQKMQHLKTLEVPIKTQIKEWLNQPAYDSWIPAYIKEETERYLSKDWVYFKGMAYDEEALAVFYAGVNHYYYLLMRSYFMEKRALLTYQANLIEEPI